VASVRIRLNRAGVRALLRGSEVQRDVERRASRIKSAAGSGYDSTSEVGPNRARAEVRTADMATRRREAESQSLLRALDAGRR